MTAAGRPPVPRGVAADLAAVRLVVFDFDGVFTDNTVYVAEDGTESVRCWRGDGLGLTAVQRLGLQVLILSTEVNPVVTARSMISSTSTPMRRACGVSGMRTSRKPPSLVA